MSRFLLGDLIDGVFNFFKNTFEGLSFDILFGIILGSMLAVIAVALLRIAFSYEKKTLRGIKKANRYLYKTPAITEENLAEFHKYMKKMPNRIRERWQLFVLEREGLPSNYLTMEYCVKRPLSNSSIASTNRQVKMSACIIALLGFILGLGYVISALASFSANISNIAYMVTYVAFLPALVILISTVFNMIIEMRGRALNREIYDAFTTYTRNIDHAVITMPDYVDYETLFTPQEINDGIPILREYLEKRAIEEQRLLEKSKRESISHSPYDFDSLGINGEQLMERAVEESENFLMRKMTLQKEVEEYEKKIARSQGNMDEIEKEANRKLQTIKENLERLDKAIGETTNRVEINYNRRQSKDEMEKKAIIEKDLRSLLSKEQVVIDECKIEIQKRKEEIEQGRVEVESALKSEYDTFAVKVYDELNGRVVDENSDVIREYQSEIVKIKAKLKNVLRELESQTARVDEQQIEIDNLRSYNELATQAREKAEQERQEALEQAQEIAPEQPAPQDERDRNVTTGEPNLINAQNAEQDLGQYYDESGRLIDYSNILDENGNPIDYSQYYDAEGNLIDYSQYYDENGNYIGPTQEEWEKMYADGSLKQKMEEILNEPEPKEPEKAKKPEVKAKKSRKGNKGNKDGEDGEMTQKDVLLAELGDLPVLDENFQDDMLTSKEEPKVKNPETAKKTVAPAKKVSGKKPAPAKKVAAKTEVKKAPAKKVETKAVPATKVSGKKPAPAKKVAAKTEVKKAPAKKVETKAASNKKATVEPTKKVVAPSTASAAVKKAESKKTEPVKKAVVKPVAKPAAPTKKTDEKPAVSVKKTEAKAASVKKAAAKSAAPTPVEKKVSTALVEDDFLRIQQQINEENAKLVKSQEELRDQIERTLSRMEQSGNQTESSKATNIKEIKGLIDQLKEQAKKAKAQGASPQQIKNINASVAELVAAITKYSSKK